VDTDHSRDTSNAVTRGLSRRAALGRLAGGGLAASLLAAAGRDHARAQATPEPPCHEPNRFVLAGAETQITYVVATDAGEPLLTYRDPDESRSFHGDEIRTQESEQFGRLVTVLVEEWHGGILELTVVLPEIILPSEDASISFATLAVLTTHHATSGCSLIGGFVPVEGGALRSYEVVTLDGMAQLIMT
jgi:hypothetical protein